MTRAIARTALATPTTGLAGTVAAQSVSVKSRYEPAN